MGSDWLLSRKSDRHLDTFCQEELPLGGWSGSDYMPAAPFGVPLSPGSRLSTGSGRGPSTGTGPRARQGVQWLLLPGQVHPCAPFMSPCLSHPKPPGAPASSTFCTVSPL